MPGPHKDYVGGLPWSSGDLLLEAFGANCVVCCGAEKKDRCR
jgi:hypothetical protein